MGILIRVTRRQANGVDQRGNTRWSETTAEVPVTAVAPETFTEPTTDGRPFALASVWKIYAPLGTEISSADAVALPGLPDTYEVIGEPAIWQHNPHAPAARGGVVFTVQKKGG